ncbi:Aste57867_8740 [Aphanomyces stellatus]|uniref:Aste57867_8740 protein n=1 Tax=Aphanomyces stellatus TaxID=120398 RepID=A0A485KLC7_9STRA|nr:hypothetical protein As57867_008706 [Aphanomyces stellatus]VFT85626.1 Aste57867_8740 [Aphanomyces stellatus]
MGLRHLVLVPAAALAAKWGIIHDGMDYVGHDLTPDYTNPPTSATAEGCIPICEADSRCAGFSWVGNNCWLKFGNPDLVPNPGVRSAAMLQPDQCLPLERDVDYWGNDIACFDGITTPDDCCTACTNTAGCNLYVVSNLHCCLKSAGTDRRPNQDPTANIRAAFRRPADANGPGLSLQDATYSPDVRVNPVGFTSVAGAQWVPGIEVRNGMLELDSILESLNATISNQPHDAPPQAEQLVASDGALVRGFWAVNSIGECATIVSMHGGVLFTYTKSTANDINSNGTCLSHVYPASNNRPTFFVTTGRKFTPVTQTLPAIYQLDSVAAATQNACQDTCLARSYCAAIQFDGQDCTLFAPAQGKAGNVATPDSSAGWVTSPYATKVNPSLPSYNKKPSRVAFYTTAHQDDHELFMSNNYHAGIADPNTKVVFVYTTAGDAGFGQKWRLARQLGTVAASTVWVDHIGRYNSKALQNVVQVADHRITRVSVGNVAHYFLCMREDNGVDEAGVNQFGLSELLNDKNAVPPMDQPTEVYVNRAAFRRVVQAIFELEANGVANVEIHAQAQENVGDHALHIATGKLVEEIVGGTKYAKCARQVYYYDYDVFDKDVNLGSPVYQLQRYAWMAQSQAIASAYGKENWSVHSSNLGRTYPRRTIPPTVSSCA